MKKNYWIELWFAIFIYAFYVTFYFKTISSLVTALFLLGFIMTIYLIVIDIDQDSQKHIAARYRIKGFWYFIVAIATTFITAVKGSTPFELIIVFIAIIESVDNYKSYYLKKKSINK